MKIVFSIKKIIILKEVGLVVLKGVKLVFFGMMIFFVLNVVFMVFWSICDFENLLIIKI